jgi:hypothetical protein
MWMAGGGMPACQGRPKSWAPVSKAHMRLLLLLSIFRLSSNACSCTVSVVPKPACELVWHSEATFTGVVTDIVDPGIPMVKPGERPPDLDRVPRRQVILKVNEVFTGLASHTKQITLETGLGGGDCGYAFESGVEYLVYAYRTFAGGIGTNICSPTRPVADAGEDLKYLRSMRDRPATSSVRVTAVDLHGTWALPRREAGEFVGLSGAKISIEAANYRDIAESDGRGQYEFENLAPGEYNIGIALDGYSLISPVPPVRVHAKGCADVALLLQLDRVVTGTVFTRAGMPASGVTIEAVPARARHENDLPYPADTATTDAEGHYELRGLQAGEYYLGTSIGSAPTKENPFSRWFYPGTERPGEAVLVHIYDKPDRQTFNLTLPESQKTRTIEGVLVWPDGKPAVGADIMLVDKRWPWQVPLVSASTDNSGGFTTEGLDGAAYRVHAVVFAEGERFAEPVTVEPGSEPAKLRLILTRTGHAFSDPVGDAVEDWRLGRGLR